MRRLIGASLLVTALLAVPSLDLHAQKDKKKDSGNMDLPTVDSDKLTGTFTGTLKSVPGTDRIFLVEVEAPVLVQTRNAQLTKNTKGYSLLRRITSLQKMITQDQRQMATARTPQTRVRAVQRLQRHRFDLQVAMTQLKVTGTLKVLPPGFALDVVKQEVEFQASESVKVRSMFLPDGGFDDKGNPKKPTKEELAKLKGKDKNLPGYESSLDKMEVGQRVQVQLAAVGKKKDKSKESKLDEDAAEDADKQMQVKLIVLLKEPQSNPSPPPKGKK
jgi:hypothetical protein